LEIVGEFMKIAFALVAMSLALSLSACTKKEPVPDAGEQVEGTTSAPSEEAAPTDEMEEKDDDATAPAAE